MQSVDYLGLRIAQAVDCWQLIGNLTSKGFLRTNLALEGALLDDIQVVAIANTK